MVFKAKILVSRTLLTRHFYCLLFSLFCFRLNSSMRNKTGTHVFWANGIHYPRVSPGAHPLTKKPEDSGYKIELLYENCVTETKLTLLNYAYILTRGLTILTEQ